MFPSQFFRVEKGWSQLQPLQQCIHVAKKGSDSFLSSNLFLFHYFSLFLSRTNKSSNPRPLERHLFGLTIMNDSRGSWEVGSGHLRVICESSGRSSSRSNADVTPRWPRGDPEGDLWTKWRANALIDPFYGLDQSPTPGLCSHKNGKYVPIPMWIFPRSVQYSSFGRGWAR